MVWNPELGAGPGSPTTNSGISAMEGTMLMQSLNKGQNVKDPELGLETLVRAMGLFLTTPEGVHLDFGTQPEA